MSICKGCITLKNQLLAALPCCDYQRLVPYLERVPLSYQQIIYEEAEAIAYVYFPDQGIISLVSTMKDGSTVEIGIVGNEGMVGMPVLWRGNSTTNQAFVQVTGSALRIKGSLVTLLHQP
ncbi:MAG: cyclic nucleotide-binding domain-containing protein [Heteroscytonema crispum UTEX LB 1556]